MAKPTPKERPYHCKLCNEALAEDELGFVCQHVAHGTMVTLVADAKTKDKPIPDTPCTACDLAMTQQRKNAEENAGIHVVCARCYRTVRGRNIDDFTPADREKGYVLVTRAQYDQVVPREKPLSIGPLFEGRELKLGFSPIPSTAPISLERMWVCVTCVLRGGVVHGALANDPQLFKRKTLKADDTVVFKAGHVLEIESRPVLKEAPPKASAKKAREEAAAKKRDAAAKKREAAAKKRDAAAKKREAAAKKAAAKKKIDAARKADAAKRIAAAKKKIADAKRIAAVKKKMADATKKLADAKRKIAAVKKKMADAKRKIAGAKKKAKAKR